MTSAQKGPGTPEPARKRSRRLGKIGDSLARARQLGTMAASGLGLTGGRAPAGPLYAQISICDPCNHKCVMCWDHPPDGIESEWTQNRFGREKPGVMSLKTFQGIVDDLHRLGTRKIELVGRGEPMLNAHVTEMVEYAKGIGLYVGMTTNASKLNATVAERLVAAGLDHLHISLNAGKPETYPTIHVTESPENYLQVKRNLRGLADARARAGSATPYMRAAFVLSTRNYAEIYEMVEAAHEVGANEAAFHHAIVHEGAPDLALSRAQFDELIAALPAAKARAHELGINSNLESLQATPPLYLQEVMAGDVVVPCYVGWYFTVILGNGEVSPCCQCSKAIDRVTPEHSFADVWKSDAYSRFRTAAKNLPNESKELDGCPCNNCHLRPRNISFHNFLHPFDKIAGGEDDQLYTIGDILRGRKQRTS
jgi:MoaA/NifB/PqqE/SkfB family radical SAM enzyme